MPAVPAEDRSVLTRTAAPPDDVLRYGDHCDQVADLRLPGPAGPAPLLLVVHGGFWRPEYDRAHVGPMAEALAAAGYATAAVEYRRRGGRGGVPVLLADVAAAVDAVPRLAARAAPDRVDRSRLVLVGHSAGGHLALWAARRRRRPPVVALAAVSDLVAAEEAHLGGGAVRDLLGEPASARPDLDPARHLPWRVPTVLVHGTDDAIVPVEQSRAFARRRPGVSLEEVPGAGHFALIDPRSAAWPRVLAAVGRLAPPVTTLA